jgi:hypothetical protein
MFFVGKWKTENYVGTLCGIAISIVAIWYLQHLGLLKTETLWNGTYDAKDILLVAIAALLSRNHGSFFRAKKKGT